MRRARLASIHHTGRRSPHGATTGAVYFGKGLGDVGVDFLRPIALKGNLGYQLADSAPRPDRLIAGLHKVKASLG